MCAYLQHLFGRTKEVFKEKLQIHLQFIWTRIIHVLGSILYWTEAQRGLLCNVRQWILTDELKSGVQGSFLPHLSMACNWLSDFMILTDIWLSVAKLKQVKFTFTYKQVVL